MTTTFTLKPRIKDAVSARDLSSQQNPRTKGMRDAGLEALTHPFEGITSGGPVQRGLYAIESTGVSSAPVRAAAQAYLDSLDATQRATAIFPVDGNEYRAWSNVHMFLMRHGVSMEYMTDVQKERALDILRATLSPSGFETSRNIMRLNETIRELTQRDIEFGEWPYWMSIMGNPSSTEPWGWQIDGHHLILNCFVLGDQVVLAPQFMGSEPTQATTGKYAGVQVFADEDATGLALAQSLNDGQKAQAILGDELPDEVFAAAFRDNFDLGYQGLRMDSLSAGQKELATSLIEVYVRRLGGGHDDVWLRNVAKHLDETYFAWIGGTGPDDVFYYRVHSPVILIEFDHLRGIALENDIPTRQHIHTVVRLPNGNDYGRDLLRQHREASPH